LLGNISIEGIWGLLLLAPLYGCGALLIREVARRTGRGWDAAHGLALAGGALLTYAWIGFPMAPLDESSHTVDLIGNTIFALGALVLLAAAIRTVHKTKGST